MSTFTKFLKRLGAGLTRHLVVVAAVLGLFWIAVTAWTGWVALGDQPLPPDRVTAKQIKVNESERLQLKANLKAYRTPTTPLDLTNISLTPPGH